MREKTNIVSDRMLMAVHELYCSKYKYSTFPDATGIHKNMLSQNKLMSNNIITKCVI